MKALSQNHSQIVRLIRAGRSAEANLAGYG